jgi:hypothetical protein
MRVSKMTVYHLVTSGELEAIRVGRSFVFQKLLLINIYEPHMSDNLEATTAYLRTRVASECYSYWLRRKYLASRP